MAKKEITLVFQDCLDCGDLALWHSANVAFAKKKNVEIVPMHYHAITADGLMRKARETAGIMSYPFFYDGERFAKNLADLFDAPVEKSEKPQKRSKKEVKNGFDK